MTVVTKHLKAYEAEQDAKVLELHNKAVREAYDLGFKNGLDAAARVADLPDGMDCRELALIRRTLPEYDHNLPELSNDD